MSPTAPVSPKVTLTARQRACLEQIARRQTNAQRLVRRAKMLLAMETGAKNCQLARQLHRNRGTVRAWRRRWGALTAKLEQLAAAGVRDTVLTTVLEEVLPDPLRPGAPAPFPAEQIVQMVAVACENPAEAGRPISHWTPREVADEGLQRGMVETISPRRVGRCLPSGGCAAPSGGVWAQRPARCPCSGC
jgi:Homeodomain-like domain